MNYLKHIVIFVCILVHVTCYSQVEHAQEKIAVHLNRTTFVAGETILFKAYILNKNTNVLSTLSKIIYIELHNVYNTKIYSTRFYSNNGTCSGYCKLPDSLQTGIYTLHIATDLMKKHIENYASNPILVISQTDTKITAITCPLNLTLTKTLSDSISTHSNNSICNIVTDKTIYHTRELVKLQIQMKNKLAANLSMTVTTITPINALEKDITESISNNTIAIDNNTNSHSVLEKTMYIVTGKLIDKTTGQGVPNTCLLLTILDSLSDLKYCYSNAEGYFYFPLERCYDNKYVSITMYHPDTHSDQYKITIDDKPIPYKSANTTSIILDSAVKSSIEQFRKLSMINKIYDVDLLNYQPIGDSTNEKTYPNFFSKYEYTIKPEDYNDVTDFEDLSNNKIIPNVKVRKKDGTYAINMFDELSNSYWESAPLILVNNIVVNDINYIAKLETRKIKQININTKHIVYGELDLYGVIFIYTKQANSTTENTTDINTVFANKTSQSNPVFIIPDYTLPTGNKIPDFRETLYWNPTIKLNETGIAAIQFYTSDLMGTYKLTIQGISKNGQPVSVTNTIEVK